MQSIAIKGINPKQTIFSHPTHKLDTLIDELPAIIGAMMAKDLGIKKGDYLTVRWRDANGTFDATDVKIVDLFASNVPAIENGQIYISLDKLQEMTLLKGHATMLTFSDAKKERQTVYCWILKT